MAAKPAIIGDALFSEPLRAEADAALRLARQVVAASVQRLPAPARPPEKDTNPPS